MQRKKFDQNWKDSYQRQCEDGWYEDGGVVETHSYPYVVLLLDSVAACISCELGEQAWLKDLQGDSFRIFSPSQPAMKMPATSRMCYNNDYRKKIIRKRLFNRLLQVCLYLQLNSWSWLG
jgi:hypothetical protein